MSAMKNIAYIIINIIINFKILCLMQISSNFIRKIVRKAVFLLKFPFIFIMQYTRHIIKLFSA